MEYIILCTNTVSDKVINILYLYLIHLLIFSYSDTNIHFIKHMFGLYKEFKNLFQ